MLQKEIMYFPYGERLGRLLSRRRLNYMKDEAMTIPEVADHLKPAFPEIITRVISPPV